MKKQTEKLWIMACSFMAACLLCVLLPIVAGAQSKNSGPIYNTVDQVPQYPGGLESFYSNLAKIIRYPADARNHNIQGRVITTFVVEKDGTLSGIKVLKSPSVSLSREAERALAASPRWQPGKLHRQVVRVQYTVPIVFTLQKS